MFSRFATRANVAKGVIRRAQSTAAGASRSAAVPVLVAGSAALAGAVLYQEAKCEGTVMSYLDRSVPRRAWKREGGGRAPCVAPAALSTG